MSVVWMIDDVYVLANVGLNVFLEEANAMIAVMESSVSRYLLVRNNLLCKQSILLEAEAVNGA